MAKRQRAVARVAIAVVVTCLCSSLRAGVADSSEVTCGRIGTHGISVSVGVVARCSLAGEDADGRKRAEAFMLQLCSAVGSGVAGIEFPLGYSEWAAELDVESEAVPPASHAVGVRVVKQNSELDRQLTKAMYRAKLPKLPNFRPRCAFGVRILPWQELK